MKMTNIPQTTNTVRNNVSCFNSSVQNIRLTLAKIVENLIYKIYQRANNAEQI